MKSQKLIISAMVLALVAATLSLPAFAVSSSPDTPTIASNDSSTEIEAAHDADDVNEVEAAEVENEGDDK